MSHKILFQFNENDRQLQEVGKIVKKLIKLLYPALTVISRPNEGFVTWQWRDDNSNQLPPRDVFRDLELGLLPDTKVDDQDMVSLGSAPERMSISSNGDKAQSPMSDHSCKMSVQSCKSDRSSKSDHSCKMSVETCKSEGSSGRVGDRRTSDYSSSVPTCDYQSPTEDWDKETRELAAELTTCDGQEPREHITVELAEVTQTSLTSTPTEETATVKQSASDDKVAVLIFAGKIFSGKISDPKDADWMKNEEEARKKRPIVNLLMSEKVAMRSDRPEDINFAANSKQIRSKNKSETGPKLG